MTINDLTAIGTALFGVNWQNPLARVLNVNERTVRRWSSGDTAPIPDWVQVDLLVYLRDHGDDIAGGLANRITTIEQWQDSIETSAAF